MDSGLKFGALARSSVHLCVDMQRMFAEQTDWRMPWMTRVLPKVLRLVSAAPSQTVFTRFITAKTPEDGQGTWKRYYRRWASMTLAAMGEDMLELIPELAAFTPPAAVIDKHVYSP